jgi:hypothetical protein
MQIPSSQRQRTISAIPIDGAINQLMSRDTIAACRRRASATIIGKS